MPRPIVEIHQEVLNVVLTPADPTLATCIVGPAYDVVDYPADKGAGLKYYANGNAGTWTTGDAYDVPLVNVLQSPGYTDFGFGAGHTVDITSAYKTRVFMEDVSVEILGTGAGALAAPVDCTLTSNTVVSAANDWKTTLKNTGGVKAGDYAVVDSSLIQVMYDSDPGAKFLSLVTGDDGTGRSWVGFDGTGDLFIWDPDAGNKTFRVLSVLDDNRLLVLDDGANTLVAVGAVSEAPGAEKNYTIDYDDGVTANLVIAADRVLRIRHIPIREKISAVDHGSKKLTLLNPIKINTSAGGVGRLATVRIERVLPATTGATAPGYEVDSGSLVLTDSDIFRLGNATAVGDGGPAIANSIEIPGFPAAGDKLLVTGATLHVDARGLKTDQPDIHELSTVPTSGKFDSLGDVHQESPLALGVATALANAGVTKISALAISSDDTAGYTAARAKISADTNIYCVVPLSTDMANVIAPFKNDAVAVSTPAKSIFRMVVGAATGVPTYGSVGSVIVGGETDTGIFDVATNNLTDAGGTFVDDGVVVGDFVVLENETFGSVVMQHTHTGAGDVGAGASDVDVANGYTFPVYLRVKEVVDNQTLDLEIYQPGDNQYVDLTVATANVTASTYTVQRNIATNKASQVAELGLRIKAATTKRLTMVYPGKCTVQGYTDQPGYYLACALGGMIASLKPHQPKNNIGIAGVETLFDSNLHFDDTQIDTISDSGYFVYVQDSPTGLPYCVHQLTTGQIGFPGVQEHAELSVVTNFDYVSRFFKKRLDPYVGVWNIIPEAIGSVSATLRAGVLSLLGERTSRIGSPLKSGVVDFVRQSEADAGALEVQLTVGLPKVLNKLEVHLISA